MRMIVEAFKDTLELGLQKKGQVVVSARRCSAGRLPCAPVPDVWQWLASVKCSV